MSDHLLAVSIGNTRTRIGAFVQGKLSVSLAVENRSLGETLEAKLQEAVSALSGQMPVHAMLASVNPPLTESVRLALAKATGDEVLMVEDDLNVPIGRQLDPETIVGQDRLLNAAAAYDVLKQACVVVDAGTAMTVDFIDGAGTFHGGAIMPGAQMMLDALHQSTAQLPAITMAKPDEPIGHNTAQAMRTAVYHGLRGAVRELVEQYAQSAGTFPMVVATGGSAMMLFEAFDLVDRLVPDLTLLGMGVTLKRHLAGESDADQE